jgi:ribose transport system permease protein
VASTTTTTTPRQGVVGRLRRMPAVLGPLLILIGLCIVITLITPRFFSPTNLAGVARQSAILLMAALGVSLVIMMGGIDLSVEGIMALSSVVASLLVASIKPETGALKLGPNFNVGILGILAAVGVATLMGLINGILHTRLRIPSFMVTLGMLSVGIGLATWLSGGIDVRVLDPFLRGLARDSIGPIPNLAIFGLVIFFIALFLERYTRFGRYIRAIGGAEDRAKLVGIPVDRYKVLAFTIAGLFYGIAGVLSTGRVGAGTPNIGQGHLFAAITAVVVGGTALTGGTGGVVQTLIGALIVIVISNGMIMVGVNNWIQLAVQGVIITIAVALTMDRKKIPIIK